MKPSLVIFAILIGPLASFAAFAPLEPETTTATNQAFAPIELQTTVTNHFYSSGDLQSAAQAVAGYQSGDSLEPLRVLENACRQSLSNPSLRKEIEPALISLLQTNATFEAQKFAAKQLAYLGSETALPALGGLLVNEESSGIACLALTTYPAGKADELLRSALHYAGPKSKVQIINTLGDRRDAKSVHSLAPATRDRDKSVAAAAIVALSKIGNANAFKAIREIRHDDRPELKQAIEEATVRYAEARWSAKDYKTAIPLYEDLLAKSDSVAVRRVALSALLKTDVDGGEKRIIEILGGKDSALKPVAIQRIAAIPGEEATEQFAAQLSRLAPEQQAILIEVLADRGDDSARLALAKALSSTQAPVRLAAIAALGRLGDPYFVSLLAPAAGSGDTEDAKAVEAALVALKGGDETNQRLVAEIKGALPKSRVPLLNAYARRCGPEANPVLLQEIENSDAAVARAALRALARTGRASEAAAMLGKLAALHDGGIRTEAQSTAVQLLGKMEDPAQRFAAVREALEKATNAETRVTLVALLPGCGTEAALAALKSATKDPDPQVREAAIRALSDWPNAAAWPALLGIYQKPESPALGSLAFRGLVRILNEQSAQPDTSPLDHYRELFASTRTDPDLKLLLASIASLPDPEALDLVLPLLSHPGVYREAAFAAKNIVEVTKARSPELGEEAEKRLHGRTGGIADPAQNLN